jgi:Flp pilus assembly protein TadG
MRRRSEKRSESGQALIEFALIMPLLFLLIVNVVNFGQFFYDWISVSNSARSGVQYMILGGAYLGAPEPPALADVGTLVRNDLQQLRNGASAKVTICTRAPAGPTAAATSYSCTGDEAGTVVPPIDSGTESLNYTLGSVYVTYQYSPLIPLWSFPKLGVNATLPTMYIHQQAAMRLIQ